MKLYHVVAMANGRVIGKDNKLPWHFPADLKHFKNLTMGSTVIMGRKTFESIGKPLPGRENLVLSRNQPPVIASPEGAKQSGFKDQIASSSRQGGTPRNDVVYFASLEEALKHIKIEKAFIIGGAEIFKQTMNQVDGIYLTRIHADYEGDAFYPEIPEAFKEKSRTVLQENPKIEVIYYER